MFAKIKARFILEVILKRHDINEAYKMVGPEDSWYDTITTVHDSLAKIRELPHESWEITSHDGLSLKALFYPGTTEKTVIWVHGYTSHAERESAFPGLFYHSLGYNVLIPYLRAHGPSEGKYISFGPLESLDIRKWVERVNERVPGSILIHGLSMGGGIALDLASVEMVNVKCILADAPSHSIPAFFTGVAKANSKKNPEKMQDCLYQQYCKMFSKNAAEYDRCENVKNCKYPLLLTAGSDENMDDILELIRQRNPQPTTVVILPGCNHGNGMYKQTKMYQDAIRDFTAAYM